MKSAKAAVAAVVVAGLMAGTGVGASAEPGDPSPSWPTDGVSDWQGISDHAEVEVLSDGTIVMAFYDDEGAAFEDYTRVRLYTRNYGFIGSTTIAQLDDSTELVDVDAWGNSAFVVVNQMKSGKSTIEVRRFTTMGLDETWGDSGVTAFGAGVDLPRAQAAAASPDGGVFVLAAERLYKFDSTGQPDMTFSGDGKAPVKLLTSTIVSDMDVDAQGRIAVLGNRCLPECRGAVTRVSPNGTTVKSFGNKGVKQLKHPSANAVSLRSIAWTSTGKLVAAGTRHPGVFLTTVRLSGSSGAVDTSFGGNGWASYRAGENSMFGGTASVQSNGRVVLVGGYGGRWTIVRFRADGKRDMSFGASGVINTVVGDEAPGWATDVAVDNLGKRIVVAGRETDEDFDGYVALGSFTVN